MRVAAEPSVWAAVEAASVPEMPATAPPAAEQSATDTADLENAATGAVDPRKIGASAPLEATAERPSTPPPAQAAPQVAPSSAPGDSYRIPPAPYTPPPLREGTLSKQPYSYPSNYYLEQRKALYQQGGYRLDTHTSYQVTLMYGKPLGFFGWLVALFSGVGALWYFLILVASGFSRDRVYLIIERDGTLYEDGSGAAHNRKAQAREGRRWGFIGLLVFSLALIWFAVMVAVGVYGVQTYEAELAAAYPDLDVFDPGPETLSAEALEQTESGVLAYGVLFGLSGLWVLGGAALAVVGYVHHAAYDVRVLPLPL
ncbi:MAG: hypothetical protein ACLFTK_09475 [Anaerolineales bacterium]